MKNKKIISIILGALLTCMFVCACGNSQIVEPPDVTKKTYDIVFDYSDGVTENKTIKVEQGGLAVLPADPIRSGFGFKGWYKSENGNGERITVDTVVSSNTRAYAYWVDYVDMTGRNQIDIGGFNGVTEFIDIPMRDPVTNERLYDEITGKELFYPTKYATETDFRLLEELGVNTIYMTFEHYDLYPNNEHMQKQKRYIEWMNKYHITCWFNDYELNDRMIALAENLDFNDAAKVAEATREVKKYTAIYENEACFKGNYIRDEPNIAQLNSSVKMAKLYNAAIPGKEMYMNLLPNYAWDFHLDMTNEVYSKYVQDFIDLYGFSYVSTDNYGINAVKSVFGTVTRSIRPEYYWRCFNVLAEAAKKAEITLENHIWTTKNLVNADEKRNYAPTMQDLRFEAANSMAFGASHINLYCASTPPSVLRANPKFVGGYGCINNGEKTPELFDNTKQLVDEIKSLSDVFPRYIWQSAAGFDAGGKYGKDLVRDAKGSYKNKLLNLKSTQDLLIGMFDEANKDGEAFMIVNNCDINNGEDASISFSLSGASCVTAYIGVENTVLTKNNGEYNLKLLPGQGAFVTVAR